MYTPYDSLRERRADFFFSPVAALLAALAVFLEGAAALAILHGV